MRKFSFFFLTALFFGITVNAKIWRVNNNPGVVADFTTAQAANDAVQVLDGDTIHLEPSVNGYGNLTTNKRLVWMSIGNFLTDNPGNQFSTTPGTLGAININAGSNGSVFSIVSTGGSIYITAPSVTILRSYVRGGDINISAADATIMQCYCAVPSAGNGSAININGSSNVFNVTIKNNVCYYVHMNNTNATATITNNIFLHTVGSVNIYNAVFQNNILRGIAVNFTTSAVSYNMHSGTGIPSGNNNLLNVDMNDVFIVNSLYGSIDKDLQLKPGSPAIGAGFGGADMGAFGGSNPFVLALQPAIPAITNMTVPSSSGGNTIQITFSAKSNN